MTVKLNTEETAPWKERYRAPSIRVSQIAPLNPEKGIIAHNRTGTLQWYAWEVTTNELQQITNTPGGHTSFLVISPDGQWVYYLKDEKGNEIGHYVRMPYNGGTPEDITPELPHYSPGGFSISRSGNRLGFVAAYDDQFHVFCIDIENDGTHGKARNIYTSKHLLLGILLSYDGSTLTVMTSERTNGPHFSLMSFDTDSGKKIAELWDGEHNNVSMMFPSPVPGDQRILATTSLNGMDKPLIWDPHTRNRTDLALDDAEGAIYALNWSSDGELILFQTFTSAVQRLYIYNLTTQEVQPLHSPAGTHYCSYFLPHQKRIYSHWQNSTRPTRIIELSPQTGEMLRTVITSGEVPPGHEWKSVTFPSSDGQTIQAWLGIPDGTGPFPTIIETHGGPRTVEFDHFLPGAQAWLDHGFAYLSVNYRGSITFGREFEQKINGQPGHWEMEDLVAARTWLVQQNIAQANAILLTGWSYGGYLTLLGLGKTPELWAGGMAGVALADWTTAYEDSAGILRGFDDAFFGGTPEEVPERYKKSSPITYAENVNAPVLIIQGRNDTRTPARQVEDYEIKMKSLDKEIEVVWYDTGHTGSVLDVEEGIKFQEIMLQFAWRVLGL